VTLDRTRTVVIVDDSRQYQMRVTELVPSVPQVQRRMVRVSEEVAPRDRLEYQQVGGDGLVPPGQQAVSDEQWSLGGDDEFRPAIERTNDAVITGR
jgi:hypothetical protein